jgi:ABC-2 type transport system ATP-binding protein
VSLTVAPGDVYGYLGPNGAGKTTSLRMLLCLIRPDAGTVRLFGRSPLEEGAAALHGVAGFVEEPCFYPYLSGRANLELLAAYDGGDASDRIDGALETVDLARRDGDRVGGYSHGMKQRLGIAAALLRDPRLLLVDEPATGLDPAGMRDMRALIRSLADAGMTVLLSSHLLTEVEELCNRVAIVRQGRVIHEGSLDALLGSTAGRYQLETSDDARALLVCEAQAGVRDAAREAGAVVFAAEPDAAAELSIALAEAGVGIRALVPHTATLEELFLELTERGPAPAPAEPRETARVAA